VRRIAAGLVGLVGLVGFCTQTMGAALVLFSDLPTIERLPGGQAMGEIAVAVIPDSAPTVRLDAFDMLIASGFVPIPSFAYSSDVMTNFPNQAEPLVNGFGYFPNEIFISANRAAPVVFPTLNLGIVTVDLTTLNDGMYDVIVNSALDEGLSGLIAQGTSESISGSVRVGVRTVPEPASLSLLALGAFAAIRFGRRRAA